MKKDRNSFFSNYTSQYQSYMPPMPIPNQNFGYTNSNINDTMYAGDLSFSNEIDNRLSKIERQINRLEQRINSLENQATNNIGTQNNHIQNITTPNNNDQNYQNMYMI